MSKQGRRGRGKRPRDGPPSLNLEAQDQSTITTQTISASLTPSNEPIGRTTTASFGPNHGPNVEIVSDAPRQKIAIPALRPAGGHDSQRMYKKGRTPHACDHCRKAKSGCSGEQPCGRCKAAHVACVYGDGKRDKERKRLTKLSKDAILLTQHNTDICDALRRIRLDMTLPQDQMRVAIDHVLAMKPPNLSGDDHENPSSASQQTSLKAYDSSIDEDPEDADESTASDDNINAVDNMIDRKQSSLSITRGKRPEVRASEKINHATDSQPGRTMNLISYHTEDSDVDYCDTSNIQIFDWPDPTTADRLVQSYFDVVHPSVPLLDRSNFMDRYRNFPRGSNNLSQEDLIFLGTLNIVFATSSVYFNLTKTQPEQHQTDHLHYLARAKILCLDGGLLYENARISTTCALGLLCLYFIATCKLNRAFTFCALAIRHAIRLDLHLRSKEAKTQEYYKEHLARVWWSLYSLECLLNALTGRPSCISNRDISVPLPSNIEIDPTYSRDVMLERTDNVIGSRSRHPNSARPSRGQSLTDLNMGQAAPEPSFTPSVPITSVTYFIFRIQLCLISHDIFTRLYCAATPISEWTETQDLIRRVDQRLLTWRTRLPPRFNIDFNVWNEPNWNDQNVLSGMGLAMEICYSRILLFRPCLCRFEGRIRNLSGRTTDVDQEAVDLCLKSAKEMITLLSAPARSVQTLYAITPWWHILHYLCEALSVLILEMAFQSQHAPDQTAYTLEEAKKGIRWLSMMSDESISARKAWEIYDRLIRHVAPMVSWSMFDLPASAPVPPGYRITAPNITPSSAHQQYQNQGSGHSIWQAEPQHGFGFGHFGPTFENTQQGGGMVANPLDHKAALEKFESMVKLHGQYDEPWQHMFQFSRDEGMDGLGQPQQQSEIELGGFREPQAQDPMQMQFDPRLGQFDSIIGLHGDLN